tara:strand:+ start:2138 stop:2416 length:279 start_codon:yes stop_codon:yes gene_type:complete
MYYQNHFDLMFYPYPQVTTTDQDFITDNKRVVVISDSQYQEYIKEQAQREILVLENKLNRYKTAMADIEQTIVKIKNNAGLLKPAEDSLTAE